MNTSRAAAYWTLGAIVCFTSVEPAWSRRQSGASLASSQIRAVTNEIVVPVTVTDSRGEFVLELEQRDFRVFDDGAEQTIDHWDLGGDPLSVALLIETSSRLQTLAPVIHATASIFTETVMALGGKAAVLSYDSTVEVRQPFTPDHEAVAKAIAQTKFDVPEMRLYDGMAEAIDILKAQPANRRRIMLIFGESQDNGNTSTLKQVARNAAQNNISIYAVGPSSAAADMRGHTTEAVPLKLPKLPPITSKPCMDPVTGHPCSLDLVAPAFWLLERGTNEISYHQLDIAAAATGGIHYGAARDSAIRNALDKIGGELHAQYIVSYRPQGERSVGYHRISVTVSRPGVSVRARPGYYLAPEAQ
jgi:Ca-activated chloride channel homolog